MLLRSLSLNTFRNEWSGFAVEKPTAPVVFAPLNWYRVFRGSVHAHTYSA